MEAFLPFAINWIPLTAADLLNLKVWTTENSLAKWDVFLRMYFMYIIPSAFLYLVCYYLWSIYLGFHHPMPQLGVIAYLCAWIIFQIGLWFLLPYGLLSQEEFRRKLRIYNVLLFHGVLIIIQNEVLNYLFVNLPTYFQFLTPFMVAVCYEFDLKVRSKLVEKMTGDPEESAMALVYITVNATYAFFIAIRLAEAEISTVIMVLAVEFALHFKIAYEIINEHKKITSQNAEKRKMNNILMSLIITELMEGFVPICHGISMAMTYYGPNFHLLSNVGSTFWGKE